jgi:hypothetical protein
VLHGAAARIVRAWLHPRHRYPNRRHYPRTRQPRRRLAQCPHCRDACEPLKRTLAICRQLPTPDVPASLAVSVKAAIRAFLNKR